MNITSENFIEELKCKNPDALTFIIKNYGNLIYKIAYTNLHSKESAEECLNDVLLKIWSSINAFTYDDTKFKNWICSIAKNTTIDMIRKEKKHLNSINNENHDIEDSQNLEELILTKEDYKNIKTNILTLKELDRNIFINRFFLGKSLKEISAMYNLDYKTVYSKIMRAREKLRKNLI